ncbi:hypothetical protein K3495_g3491 [Podosphaera aphanis]|nr:hypothetical protein K3495_g3491 [Podosphaera aphanis]
MFSQSVSSLLFLASLATAHFTIQYPEARGNAFAEGASQRIYPCANVNSTSESPRTLWPIEGGPVSMKLYHSWTYLFVNLGLGSDNLRFNISLTPNLLNETGKGSFCLPKLTLPSGLVPEEGQNASLQVVAVGKKGDAFYSCSDITFSKDAPMHSAETCSNSTGVAAAVIDSSAPPSPPSPPSSGAPARFDPMIAGGLAFAFGVVVIGHLL